ncbi:MAG: hypothetical protein IT204_22905 [Fimbriimonadaceae bacterium]|nr:hypothetical protein [Fimbriimonadaceae bacterium]
MPSGPITARTPSQAQYFTWTNNTDEGPTAAQTAVNLEFLGWLRREYGLQLDLYAFDAGCVDGAGFYGSTASERCQRQFPDGFGPLAATAAGLGIRQGLWDGPDGFGETPAAAAARIEQMVALCRDHGFALFKFDAVCGGLRPDQQEHFIAMLRACREAVPDLILLNHRLELGAGLEYATTWLWEGAETYLDVHQANAAPGLHQRLCALERGLPPDLARCGRRQLLLLPAVDARPAWPAA